MFEASYILCFNSEFSDSCFIGKLVFPTLKLEILAFQWNKNHWIPNYNGEDTKLQTSTFVNIFNYENILSVRNFLQLRQNIPRIYKTRNDLKIYITEVQRLYFQVEKESMGSDEYRRRYNISNIDFYRYSHLVKTGGECDKLQCSSTN